MLAVIITLVDENNIVFAVATSNEAGEAVFHKSAEREPIKDGAYFIQYLAPTGYSSQLTSAGPIMMNTGEGSTEGYQVSGQSILEEMESQKNTFLIQPIRTGPSLAINARDLDNSILLTEGLVSLVLRDEEGREISTFDIDLSDSHIQFEDGSSTVYLNLPGSIQNDTTIEYLQNGIYQLYVNKGPFGYRPVSQEIPLEINFNVRTDPETGIDDPDYLSVKNSPSGQGEALFYTKNDIAIMPLTIDFQKITYPMTGGVGSILFALIGGGIMWIAIKKKNAKMFIEDQNGRKV